MTFLRRLPDEPALRSRTSLGTPVDLDMRSQRRVVCVVFADVVGFTTLSEALDHEYLTELMFDCWHVLDQVLLDYGAAIDKHIGDSVLATFGARSAREDDPVRAVRSALALHRALVEFSSGVQDETGHELRLRCAVSMGEVTVAVVSASTTEASVTGTAVNRASRLQTVAAPGTVIVDEPTHRATAWAIGYGDPTGHELRGIEGTTRAWEATGIRDTRGRSGRPPSPEAGPVGRRPEQARLATAIDLLVQGSGGAVSVVGPPGSGKSMLVDDARAYAEACGVRWVDARAHSYTRTDTYGVTRQILRDLMYVPDDADESMVRARLGVLTGVGGGEVGGGEVDGGEVDGGDRGEASDAADLLGFVLGVDAGGSPPGTTFGTNPALRHRLATGAVTTAVVHAAASTPLVVTFEDTQWCDELSVDVIGALHRACATAGFLLLLQGREVPHDRIGPFAEAECVELGPIDEAAVAALARGTLNDFPGAPVGVPLDDGLAGVLMSTSAGNPFFLVELVRLLFSDGRLTVRDGRWDLARELVSGAVGIPDSIRRLMTAQLDAIPGVARLVAQEASVIGPEFAAALLEGVSDVPTEVPGACVSLLEGRIVGHVAGESRSAMIMTGAVGTVYAFVHGLMREAAYEMMSHRDRRRYHGRVAEALGSADPEADPAPMRTLRAHHFVASDRPDRAAPFALVAGEAAAKSFANHEARGWFESALGALDQLARPAGRRGGRTDTVTETEAATLVALRTRALYGRADAEMALGRAETAREALLSALSLAEADPTLLPEIPELCRRMARTYEVGGASYPLALEWVGRGLAAAGAAWAEPDSDLTAEVSVAEPSATARLCLVAGLVRLRLGEYGEAATWAARAMRLAAAADAAPGADGIALGLDLAQAHNLRCIIEHLLGNPAAAVDAGRESLRRYRELGDLVGQEKAHSNVADALLELGETSEAISHFRSSQVIARRVGDPVRLGASLLNVGPALVVLGDLDGAMQGYEKALPLLDGLSHVEGASICRANMAGVLVRRGDGTGALALLTEAERGFDAIGAQSQMPEVHRTRALALALVHDMTGAAAAAEAACETARALGRRVEEGMSLRVRAEVEAARGGPLNAVHADFAASGEILEELGARFELGRTYLAWARLSARGETGDRALAGTLAGEASRLFRDVGSLGDAAEADRIRRLLQGR